jgi:hypothetical protein
MNLPSGRISLWMAHNPTTGNPRYGLTGDAQTSIVAVVISHIRMQ